MIIWFHLLEVRKVVKIMKREMRTEALSIFKYLDTLQKNRRRRKGEEEMKEEAREWGGDKEEENGTEIWKKGIKQS